ncbi:MAG TPA: hypothetical protein VGI35_02745, partial [Steroidobacteraceae bacterium]
PLAAGRPPGAAVAVDAAAQVPQVQVPRAQAQRVQVQQAQGRRARARRVPIAVEALLPRDRTARVTTDRAFRRVRTAFPAA